MGGRSKRGNPLSNSLAAAILGVRKWLEFKGGI